MPSSIQGEQEQGAEGDEPKRYQYVEQIGTSAHRRMLSHLEKKGSVLQKHQEEYNHRDQDTHELKMKVLRSYRGIMEGQVSESNIIAARDKSQPNTLMNSKSEYQKTKLVRFEAYL